jgi:hypothetical protein
MLAFEALYPDLAATETRVLHVLEPQHGLPEGSFALQEAFCIMPGCDCRRVMINVLSITHRAQVATISYGFEPPEPPFEDEGQIFLDPLNPQSKHSPAFLDFVEELLETDHAYRERIERHYALWRRVVDDPAHPQHHVIERYLDSPDTPAIFRRATPKPVSAKSPCPCGSGRRYARCCKARSS